MNLSHFLDQQQSILNFATSTLGANLLLAALSCLTLIFYATSEPRPMFKKALIATGKSLASFLALYAFYVVSYAYLAGNITLYKMGETYSFEMLMDLVSSPYFTLFILSCLLSAIWFIANPLDTKVYKKAILSLKVISCPLTIGAGFFIAGILKIDSIHSIIDTLSLLLIAFWIRNLGQILSISESKQDKKEA